MSKTVILKIPQLKQKNQRIFKNYFKWRLSVQQQLKAKTAS